MIAIITSGLVLAAVVCWACAGVGSRNDVAKVSAVNKRSEVNGTSVLIKGMKMPRNCDECELNYDCFRCILPIEDSLLLDKDTANSRLPNCPLVELPPHGRLIDADALSNKMGVAAWYNIADRDDVAVNLVIGAPTILDEERGGDIQMYLRGHLVCPGDERIE